LEWGKKIHEDSGGYKNTLTTRALFQEVPKGLREAKRKNLEMLGKPQERGGLGKGSRRYVGGGGGGKRPRVKKGKSANKMCKITKIKGEL